MEKTLINLALRELGIPTTFVESLARAGFNPSKIPTKVEEIADNLFDYLPPACRTPYNDFVEECIGGDTELAGMIMRQIATMAAQLLFVGNVHVSEVTKKPVIEMMLNSPKASHYSHIFNAMVGIAV